MEAVYIAGLYMGGSYHQTRGCITYAREWAEKVVRSGHAFYCPHLSTAHVDAIAPDVPKYFWREMNLDILRRCDAPLLIHGWDNDEVTQRGVHYAEGWGIPVVVDVDQIAEIPAKKGEKPDS